MSHADSANALAAPAVSARDIKLPTFCAIDAPTWFKRAEVQFRLKNENSDTRKADHVLASIPDDVFPLLAEWLDDQGDTPVTYQNLKARLLSQYVPSPEERAERLLQLTRQPLGDQRSSTAFQEMKALTRLPPYANGAPRKLDLLRILWLLRLPDSVRAGITNFTDVNEAELLKQSDALQNSTKAASRRPIFAATHQEDTLHTFRSQDDAPHASYEVQQPNDDALTAAAYLKPRRPTSSYPQQPPRRPQQQQSHQFYSQPPRGIAPKKADFNSKFCFFHSKFGHAARNCRQPCSWPKNLL